MASGSNLDALSAIATVIDPDTNNEPFSGEGTLISSEELHMLPGATVSQLMAEVTFDTQPSTVIIVKEAEQAEVEGTYCDLDESTQQSKQQLEPRIVKEGMNDLWQKELDTSQFIACTVPGCEMRYSTIFSFERHYKWCTGEKGQGVEKCPYCDCQFLATLQGIEDHVIKDHPSYMPDYNARRVAKKILADGRALERKTALEREARALEMKNNKESKRSTCYNRKSFATGDSATDSDGVDSGRKKTVRFQGGEGGRGRGRGRGTYNRKQVTKSPINKIEGEAGELADEESVDDPSMSSPATDKPLRVIKSRMGEKIEPVIPITRNWGEKRKTYSRNSSSGDKGGTSQSEGEDEESQHATTTAVVEATDEQEGNETVQDVLVNEAGEVIRFLSSSESEALGAGTIPIETDGCITIGSEFHESDEENYQLVIVTGTSDAAEAVQMAQDAVNNQPPKKLSLIEEIAKAFEDDLDSTATEEISQVQLQEKTATKEPQETVLLALRPGQELDGSTFVQVVETEDGMALQVPEGMEIVSEDMMQAVEIAQEELKNIEQGTSANVTGLEDAMKDDQIEVPVTTKRTVAFQEPIKTVEPETESNNIAVVISHELGEALASDGEGIPNDQNYRKKSPRVLLPDRVYEDEDSMDKFQLKVPAGLKTTIGDDFLPKNMMLRELDRTSYTISGEEAANRIIADIAEMPSTSSNNGNPYNGESSSNLFDRLNSNSSGRKRPYKKRNVDIEHITDKRRTRYEHGGQLARDQSIVAFRPRVNKRRQLDGTPVHQAIFGEQTVPKEFHMLTPSKGAIPANIQSIIAASGGAQTIKVYASNKDGTLAPLDDLSLLSGSSQIKFMSTNKDGKLTPVQGDPETLLRTVKRMVNPGIKLPDMEDEEDLDDEYDDDYDVIQMPKKRGRGRPRGSRLQSSPLARMKDGSVYIRKPSFLAEGGSTVGVGRPRLSRGRGTHSLEHSGRRRGRPARFTPPVLTRTRADDDNYSPTTRSGKRTRLSYAELAYDSEDSDTNLNAPSSTNTRLINKISDCLDSPEELSELNGIKKFLLESEGQEEEEMEDDASSTSSHRENQTRLGKRRRPSEELDESSQTGNDSSSNLEPRTRRSRRDTEANFQCSACRADFSNRAIAKNHIISKHNGLARINDDSPLTPREVSAYLRLALRTKKYLICNKPDCGRHFRSTAGFITHEKVCGLEIQMLECPVCHRAVKETSLPLHLRQHTLSMERRKIAAELEAEDGDGSTRRKFKTTRRAALMANTRLEQFVRAELGDDMERGEEETEKIMRGRKESEDNDYFDNEDELVDDKESKDDEDYTEKTMGQTTERIIGKSVKWITAKVNLNYKGKFTPPDEHRTATSEELAEFKKEYLENGYINCKVEECGRKFMSVPGMVQHWAKCNINDNWGCLLCENFTSNSVKEIYLHLSVHTQTDGGKHKGSGMSKCNSGYRDLLVTELEKPGALEKLLLNPKMVSTTYEYITRNHSDDLYAGLRPHLKDWTLLEASDEYLPEKRESVPFSVQGVEESTSSSSWNKLGLFEAQEPTFAAQLTLNIGGPIWACSWCPTPVGESAKAEQYAAISCSLSMENHKLSHDDENKKGLLQIWNFGVLSKTNEPQKPRMELAIAHTYGAIWDMQWCPSGCWDDPTTAFTDPDFLPRLGLLSLACADGQVRILSIPHPQSILAHQEISNTQLPSGALYAVSPVCILPPSEPGIIVNSFRTCCSSISFEKTDGHAKIATGYANGLVFLWDLQSDSPLLLARHRQIGNEPLPRLLRPYHQFLAHSSCLTSLTFSTAPEGRFLYTSGMDKFIKLWDLDDTSVPVDQLRKCLFRKLRTSHHSKGVFGAMDQSFNINSTHTMFKECGYYDFSLLANTYHNSCIWDLSVSDWLNSELSCDVTGAVSLITLPLFNRNLEVMKTFSNLRWPIYYTEIKPVIEPGIDEVFDSNLLPLKSCDTFAKISQHYGLVFKDAPLNSVKQLSFPKVKNLTKVENMSTSTHGQYPLASINTVCWNPNLGSHLWFLTAGQSGLARLSCMSALRQPAAGRLIANLQQNNLDKT